MLVFEPDGGPARAGIVLFHGGALRGGSADGLAPHGRELASRGIFAVSAGYRLLGSGATTIDDCIDDVRLAVGQFASLAAARALDAARLASGGSSAGAHLALAAAMIAANAGPKSPATPATDPGVAAVVAFNPAGLDLLSFGPDVRSRLEDQIGIARGRLVEYSLLEFVRPGNPPMLIHHGTRDAIEPIASVRRFRDAMVRAGNVCTLREYEDAEHGFHYPGHNAHFGNVIDATARFLFDRPEPGSGVTR